MTAPEFECLADAVVAELLRQKIVDRLADAVITELRRRGTEPFALGEDDAARLLGISPRSLFSLRQAGQIPHTTLGARVVYPLAALREWLSSRTVQTPTGKPAESPAT